jgi:hypothetical protein
MSNCKEITESTEPWKLAERIISHDHASPADFWYDQARHEWVIVPTVIGDLDG